MSSRPTPRRGSEWTAALMSLMVGFFALALVLKPVSINSQPTALPAKLDAGLAASNGDAAAAPLSFTHEMSANASGDHLSSVTNVADARFTAQLGSSTTTRSTTSSATTKSCRIYPIALHTSSLQNINPGAIIYDIYNGSGPGQFGWLTWTGDTDENSLVKSLTPPGDVETYTNPDNPSDRVLTKGDWVSGRPGLADSARVRNALNKLKSDNDYFMIVPVWDIAQGSGNNVKYRIVDFVLTDLISFQLPEQDRITAKYKGRGCPPPPPPPTSITSQLHIHSRYDPAQQVYLSTSNAITWPQDEVLGWLPKFDIAVPRSPDPNYTYRLRIIAWSYVRSENSDGTWSVQATATDSLGRTGCREGPQPSGDASGLNGCIYAYPTSTAPQVSDLLHIFWSVRKPLSLDAKVYAYQLPRLESPYIVAEVKYAIDVMYTYDPDGAPAVVGTPQFHTQRYKTNLVTPRSAQ